MHYITTRKILVLGALGFLTAIPTSFAQASSDNRVFYRANDGKDDTVYVIPMQRNELRKQIKRKVYLWESLKSCKATPRMTFTDPFFSGEKVVMQVKADCTLEVENVFGTLTCKPNPLDAGNVAVLFQQDGAIGYGAEYMTAYEKQYTERHCKVK